MKLTIIAILAAALMGGCAQLDQSYRSRTQEDDISLQGGYDVATRDATGQIVWRHVYRDPSK